MKDSLVPDMYEKITEESSLLGKIMSYIPGFKGYLESSRRREADQMLRQTISGRIEAVRLQLGGVHEELSRDIIKAMDHAEPLGRIDTRLMGLAGKIKDAPSGYTGFFAAVKIENEDLAKIYAFDEKMLGYADQFAAGTAALSKAVQDNGDIAAAIRDLDAVCREAVAGFDGRDEMLKGIE